MKKQGYGSIVNTASVGGIRGVGNQSGYAASKHGVVGLTRNSAVEYGQFGISVKAIAPGAIMTPMVEGSLYGVGEEYVGALPSLIVAITSFIITVIIRAILKSKSEKFAKRTKAGLEASRYMDGLKLYIEMAEKDRLAFLQSVKGADTSDAGIVKLYEKLLPYAALFGVEESWMKELEKYYDVANVETPEWYSGHSEIIRAASFASIIRDTSNIVSSTSYSSSSSGSSGGGGGGFSGGGGGGGGGGGR